MKRNSASPSIKDWRELYEAAIEFKKLRPWTWMSDTDLFGVQNPQNGEIGYCCIMGQIEEVFALAVYLGPEGLDAYLKIQSEEIGMDDPDAMHIQRCLIASFEEREYLEKEDLQTIKKLGLKFRGRNEWPQFRNYQPGYVPWYLTKEEARFLTIALQQAMEVALRFKKDWEVLIPPKESLLFVRVPVRKGGKTEWKDAWIEPPAPVEDEFPVPPVDELRIQRIKKRFSNREGIWEVDFFYFQGAVEDRKRPYFPRASAIIDHSNGLVLDVWVIPPWKFLSKFQEHLLSFVEEREMLPERILINKYENMEMLEPITSRLDIDMEIVEILEGVGNFKAEMYDHF